MQKNILVIFILLISSCFRNEIEEVPEVCYENAGLLIWTVNEETQTPGNNIEPNTGFNSDYLYAIDKHGSWSINLSNELYTIVFADFDELVSSSELDDFSESEWQKTILERGSYPFVFEAHGRQEITLNQENPLVFLGDTADEVLGGNVVLSFNSNSECNYQVLEVNAVLGSENEPYSIKLKLQEPYIYP